MGIHVWPRVLCLALLLENVRDDLVDGRDDLEEVVVWHVLQAELTLSHVPRVSLAEDRVAIARDDLACLQGLPRKLADRLVRDALALLLELLVELKHPSEHLLVREAVERACQAAHGSREGEIRVRQG